METKIRMRSRATCALSAGLLCLMLADLNHPRSSPLGHDSPGWREATPGYEFSFPLDHGAHPDYRIEWWYYTGNLDTKSVRRFGYQLTFCRIGVVRETMNASRWALRDLYMAHFAISDIAQQSFHSFERIIRAGIGWAGASIGWAGADALAQNEPGEEQQRLKSTQRIWLDRSASERYADRSWRPRDSS